MIHFPVPVTMQDDVELALLALQIADRRAELARLQVELAPLESAFVAFERRVASQTATIVAERDRLRHMCDSLDHYTSRLQARLVSDPSGHLSAVFTPEELRAIGDLFGIQLPDDMLQAASHTTTSHQNWQWADDDQSEHDMVAPLLANDDAAELRQLYRQLARAFHPDLAMDASEQHFRQEMMLQVNHAWHTRDLAAMRALQRGILDPFGDGPLRATMIELIRRRNELAHVAAACSAAQSRLLRLRGSRTRPLWGNVTLAKAAIARHIRKLEADIALLETRRVQLVEEFRQALGAYAANR